MFELTEDFLKLLQIAFTIVGLLAIFLTFISYNITIVVDEASREAFILGNSVLSSNCITDGTKGLFIESKLDTVVPSCFNYNRGLIEITIPGRTWSFNLGSSSKGVSTKFNIVVKIDVTGTNEIKTGEMVVSL